MLSASLQARMEQRLLEQQKLQLIINLKVAHDTKQCRVCMKQNKLLQFLFLLCIGFMFEGKAIAQSVYVGENETVSLNVPNVSPGYVDKAIWACSNSAIAFVEKSTTSATIKAIKPFEDYATIELVYVQKYIDAKGFTRAITYTKNFYVRYKYNGSSGTQTMPTKLIIEPEMRVAIGEKVKIPYSFSPNGSSAEIYTSCRPGTFFNGIVNHKDGNYLEGWARAAGKESLRVYFYDKNDESVSAYCTITVYDPTWTTPQSLSIQPIMLLKMKESKRLFVNLTPAKANTLFNWTSDKYAVASVDNGKITAKKQGVANVRVKTSEGLLGQCTVVVVSEKDYIQGIKSAINRAANAVEIVETEFVK